MHCPHKMPFEISKLVRWNRYPLRLVEINSTTVAIAHRAGGTACITLKARSQFVYPELPTFSLSHFCQLVQHLFVACVNLNLILMDKCFNFCKVCLLYTSDAAD